MPRVLILTLCLFGGLAACNSSGPSKEDLERQIEIHTDTARAYINMGEFQRAEAQARKGLSLEPDSFDLKLALARALQMQGTTIKVLEAESIYRDLPRDEDFRVVSQMREGRIYIDGPYQRLPFSAGSELRLHGRAPVLKLIMTPELIARRDRRISG